MLWEIGKLVSIAILAGFGLWIIGGLVYMLFDHAENGWRDETFDKRYSNPRSVNRPSDSDRTDKHDAV